jgi:hypothetical protein
MFFSDFAPTVGTSSTMLPSKFQIEMTMTTGPVHVTCLGVDANLIKRGYFT